MKKSIILIVFNKNKCVKYFTYFFLDYLRKDGKIKLGG